MNQFRRRMDGGIKIALEIDRMEKTDKTVTIKAILKAMKELGNDEEESRDIPFFID